MPASIRRRHGEPCLLRRRHARGGVLLRRAQGDSTARASATAARPSRCSTASISCPASPAARCSRPITACASARRSTDFRERFLLRNAEESLNTRVSIVNLGRAIGGGLNDATHLPRWLDDNLFGGATFRDFRTNQRPRIWINASDIYNRTPFVFGSVAFDAMCSDLMNYPISEAVAASAAVPVVFAPIVLETYPGRCQTAAAGLDRARPRPTAMRSRCCATSRRRSTATTPAAMRYVKLLDGGLVDNFGLSGFTIALLSATRPYEPLTPQQAARIRRVMFLIVDSGRGPSGNWSQAARRGRPASTS